jgi:MYXO-CTERM domain-containing protein
MSLHNRFRSMLLVSAAGLLGLAGSVQAGPSTYVELVADCNQQGDDCGPRGENDGPGHEQARGAWFMDADGTPWVSVVVMSAKAIPNRDEGPYQCRYFAWKLDAVSGPQRMVDGRLLTNNRGNRPCNHPDLQFAGGTDMLFLFGTNDDNQANVQPYAQVLDAMTGVAKSGRTNLGDNNGNDGAGTATMLRTGASMAELALPASYPKRFVYCYNDNGNNADCTVADIQSGGNVNVQDRIDDVIDPANIPRPFQQQISIDGKFAVTAAMGDQRPPEDGAYLRVINVANPNAGNGGKVSGQQALMMSNENNELYANSPEIAAGPTADTFYMTNITSQGGGKDNDNGGDKGASTFYAHVVQFTADNQLQILSTAGQVGHYAAHASLCNSTHGADGASAGILVEAAITGSGPGVVTPLYYNAEAMTISEGPTKVTTPYSADSGYLANLYGNNPNNQGRDFVSCIGSVPNPGYGIENSFPDFRGAKTLIVTATYGKEYEDDYKNSMYIAFVPAHTPGETLDPDDPGTPPDQDDPNTGGDDTGDGSGDGSGSGDGDGSGGNNGSSSSAAGGCAAGGNSTGAGFLFVLGLIGLAVRRRRS